ncbi:hypothetical protein ACFXKI_10110 [Streptomyces mirabilis]|uniref:hypothetical protein n=1 Tax=Streptomyces mirabilis TaxID=68239 RepID=UPI00368CBC77
MPATKAPPANTRKTPAEPVLENFYDLGQAAIRLNLRKKDEPGKRGEKWLRDGYNRPEDGSKGRKFPGRYMAGRLKFSESELAVIAEIALEESTAKQQAKPRPSAGRPRRRRAAVKTPALATP